MSEINTARNEDGISEAADAAKRMGFVESWKDLKPNDRRTLRKVRAGAIVGLVAAGALAGPTLAGNLSDGYENFKTPDQVVDYEDIDLGQGDGLLAEVQIESQKMIDALALEGKIDPAKVDFSSIPEIVNEAQERSKQLSGDTELQPGQQFSLLLVDLGATYKFELAPLQNANLGLSSETDNVQPPTESTD